MTNLTHEIDILKNQSLGPTDLELAIQQYRDSARDVMGGVDLSVKTTVAATVGVLSIGRGLVSASPVSAAEVQSIDPGHTHVVTEPGDTVWELAKQFNSSVSDIARASSLPDPNKIQAGQKLVLPVEEQTEILVTPTTENYQVVKGDRLWSIAEGLINEGRFPEGTSINGAVDKLVEMNNLTVISKGDQEFVSLQVNQQLTIPSKTSSAPLPEVPAPEVSQAQPDMTYVVQKGDTVWDIIENGVTNDDGTVTRFYPEGTNVPATIDAILIANPTLVRETTTKGLVKIRLGIGQMITLPAIPPEIPPAIPEITPPAVAQSIAPTEVAPVAEAVAQPSIEVASTAIERMYNPIPEIQQTIQAKVDAILALRTIYEEAGAATNLDWRVIAAIDFRESNNDPNRSAFAGEPLGGHNPDGHQNLPSDKIGNLIAAGDFLKHKAATVYGIELTPQSSVEDLAKAALAYNRGTMYEQVNAPITTSPYIMNGIDGEHTWMDWPKGPEEPQNTRGREHRNIGFVPILIALRQVPSAVPVVDVPPVPEVVTPAPVGEQPVPAVVVAPPEVSPAETPPLAAEATPPPAPAPEEQIMRTAADLMSRLLANPQIKIAQSPNDRVVKSLEDVTDDGTTFTHDIASGEQTPVSPKLLSLVEGIADHGEVVITSLTTGKHSPNSDHYSGQAIDFEPLNSEQLTYLVESGQVDELIYAHMPDGLPTLKNGLPFRYSEKILDNHTEHVHVSAQ